MCEKYCVMQANYQMTTRETFPFREECVSEYHLQCHTSFQFELEIYSVKFSFYEELR